MIVYGRALSCTGWAVRVGGKGCIWGIVILFNLEYVYINYEYFKTVLVVASRSSKRYFVAFRHSIWVGLGMQHRITWIVSLS